MSDDSKIRELEREFRETVVNELKSIRESQSVLYKRFEQVDKSLELHIQKTEYELKAINGLDKHQNMLLDKHIEGVRTNAARLNEERKMRSIMEQQLRKDLKKDTDKIAERIGELEKYPNFVITLKKVVIYVSTLLAGIASITKYLQWW